MSKICAPMQDDLINENNGSDGIFSAHPSQICTHLFTYIIISVIVFKCAKLLSITYILNISLTCR